MAHSELHIYPVHDQILGRTQKENLLNQKGKVIWFTGLSGSGKTTLAKHLELRLHSLGFLTQILDGDNIRAGINNNLGFSEADRLENIRRISEVSKLFVNCGVITLNCFISPTEEIRNIARTIIGKEDLIEVYVNAPLGVCEQRDTKGLYARARRGEIPEFTGISSPFEPPREAAIEVRTDKTPIDACVDSLLQIIFPQLKTD